MPTARFKAGDVLLVHFPFTDHTTGKLRPVVVMSKKEHNTSGDVIVVPISSRADPNDHYGFPIDDSGSGFNSTGLRASSNVKWSKAMTFDSFSSVIEKKLGQLPADCTKEIGRLLCSILEHS